MALNPKDDPFHHGHDPAVCHRKVLLPWRLFGTSPRCCSFSREVHANNTQHGVTQDGFFNEIINRVNVTSLCEATVLVTARQQDVHTSSDHFLINEKYNISDSFCK